MALFGRKKKDEKDEKSESVVLASPTSLIASVITRMRKGNLHASSVLRRPRITEKATDTAGRGVYVFDVSVRAGKKEIAEAIKSLYKVTPTKVRTVSIPQKTVMSRKQRSRGVKGGGKKAYVYLKKGDTIELV